MNELVALVKVVVPSIIRVEPVEVKVSALVRFNPDPAKLRVWLPKSNTAVPPVVLNVKLPLKSAVSDKVSEPLAPFVPIVTILRELVALVKVVVPSIIRVEPVEVKVSA